MVMMDVVVSYSMNYCHQYDKLHVKLVMMVDYTLYYSWLYCYVVRMGQKADV